MLSNLSWESNIRSTWGRFFSFIHSLIRSIPSLITTLVLVSLSCTPHLIGNKNTKEYVENWSEVKNYVLFSSIEFQHDYSFFFVIVFCQSTYTLQYLTWVVNWTCESSLFSCYFLGSLSWNNLEFMEIWITDADLSEIVSIWNI